MSAYVVTEGEIVAFLLGMSMSLMLVLVFLAGIRLAQSAGKRKP